MHCQPTLPCLLSELWNQHYWKIVVRKLLLRNTCVRLESSRVMNQQRTQGTWFIHSKFGSTMSSFSSSSSSSSESYGSVSESIGSSPPPPPPLLPFPSPPMSKSKTYTTMVPCSPCWHIGGSSLSSIASVRPSIVVRTTSCTDNTTTPVWVVFFFLDVYRNWCTPGISANTLRN